MADNNELIERTSSGSGDEMEIDLAELMYRFLSKWKLIAIFAILGALFAYLITASLITPKYKATSTIYVLSRTDSAINMSDLQIGTALTDDYIKVFDMWEVHQLVKENYIDICKLSAEEGEELEELTYTYDELKSMLSVVNDSGTRMLDISITSTDPKEAANLANTYAYVVRQYIADTMSTDMPSIMSSAQVPKTQISPSKTKNTILGFMVGAMIAAAYVFIRFIMDDKFKTADDIRKYTGLPTLAVIPVETFSVENDKKRQRGK